MVQIMYQNARSQVRIKNSYNVIKIQVGVHQGSVLSSLLFTIVLDALSREFRIGCPWELLYGDDLIIIAETMDELLCKLDLWKKNIWKSNALE